MKIIKKLLAFTLSASMVLGASGLDAFAKTEEDVSKTETNTSGIEANKSYLVPLTQVIQFEIMEDSEEFQSL